MNRPEDAPEQDRRSGVAEDGSNDDHDEITTGNPVKDMFVLAALYLPMGFFLWFWFGSALMWLPARIADLALSGLFPSMFDGVVQLGMRLEIQTSIQMTRTVEGRVALLNTDINPMIYAWGMALLFGLIMATPMSVRRRLGQMVISYLVVSLVTAWGVFWESWTNLAFRLGPDSAAAVAGSGLPPTMIALFYQLGYLMLPAVVPLATWILMNRPFLETVAFRRR